MKRGYGHAWIGLACALGVVGCHGIGNGVGPTGISITANGVDTDLLVVECATAQLVAIVHANDANSDADATARVTWTSSNPGVIDISNGDIELEPGSGQYFPAGTVIARRPGSAIIRADYVGLSASFSVTADPIRDLRITPDLQRLVPGSVQTFALEADLVENEPPVDVTGTAIWRLLSNTVPVDIADVSTLNLPSGPLDRPFRVEAQLFTCDRRVQMTLQLGSVAALRISQEQPEDLPIPLMSSDEIRVEAVFDDAQAAVQNLSDQVEIKQVLGSSSQAALSPVGEALQLTGFKANVPVQFRLRYPSLELETLTRVTQFADLELMSLRVSPETLKLTYPDTARLEAYGVFADGYERPIRRNVVWVTEDTDLLEVTSVGPDAGDIAPLGVKGIAEIEALSSNTRGEVKATADVTIVLP